MFFLGLQTQEKITDVFSRKLVTDDSNDDAIIHSSANSMEGLIEKEAEQQSDTSSAPSSSKKPSEVEGKSIEEQKSKEVVVASKSETSTVMVSRPSTSVNRMLHSKAPEQQVMKEPTESRPEAKEVKVSGGGGVTAAKAVTSTLSDKGSLSQAKGVEITPPTTITATTKCIVCKKTAARTATIYCSDDCIRKHAQSAINQLANRLEGGSAQSTTGSSPSSSVGTATSGSATNAGSGNEKSKKRPKELFEEVLTMPDRKPKVERVFTLYLPLFFLFIHSIDILLSVYLFIYRLVSMNGKVAGY